MLKLIVLSTIFGSLAQALTIGSPAPAFSAKNQDGKTISLSDFAGKPVLLYFYPKDDTPGCTKEACEFRDKYAEFKKRGAVVLGVSAQDEKSHKEFSKKNHLTFDLLADNNGAIAKSYGIGKYPVIGLYNRQSVLIDRGGHVFKFYEKVNADTHAQEVLKDLENIDKNRESN
jgi:peroxiredoxin Q/BCP